MLPPAVAAADPCDPSRGARPSRSRISSFIKTVFPRPVPADEDFPFTETLAGKPGGATAVHMGPCPIRRCRKGLAALSGAKVREIAQTPTFQDFVMQDYSPSASVEN